MAAADIARTAGRLAAFLAALLVVGLLVVPRLMRVIVKLDRPETTIVSSVGLAFGFSLLAAECGYSVALGAFIAGSLIAESGVEKTVEHLVQPIRDMFAAIFFVSVGMLIDPEQIATHWLVVLVFLLAVVFGKDPVRGIGRILNGAGHSEFRANRHERCPDRRVLVHHCERRSRQPGDRSAAVFDGDRRFGDYHVAYSLVDSRRSGNGRVGRPQTAPLDSNICCLVFIVDRTAWVRTEPRQRSHRFAARSVGWQSTSSPRPSLSLPPP